MLQRPHFFAVAALPSPVLMSLRSRFMFCETAQQQHRTPTQITVLQLKKHRTPTQRAADSL
jgi:hypothetical protein